MIFCFHKYLFVFLKIGDQKKEGKKGVKKRESQFWNVWQFFNVQKIRQKIY